MEDTKKSWAASLEKMASDLLTVGKTFIGVYSSTLTFSNSWTAINVAQGISNVLPIIGLSVGLTLGALAIKI